MSGYWSVERDAETGTYTLQRTTFQDDALVVDRSIPIGGTSELAQMERAVSDPLGMLPGERMAVLVSHFLTKAEALGIPEAVRTAGATAYLQHILDTNRAARVRPGMPDPIAEIEDRRKTG